MRLDEEVLTIFKEAASLAQMAQPIFHKQAACEDLAVDVSDELVRCGLVPIEKRAEVANKLKNPLEAYEFIVKLANKIPAESLGELSDKKASYESSADEKFYEWILS